MTDEAKMREVGGLLWLAGLSIEETEERAAKLSRQHLGTCVRAGYIECAALWAFLKASFVQEERQ